MPLSASGVGPSEGRRVASASGIRRPMSAAQPAPQAGGMRRSASAAQLRPSRQPPPPVTVLARPSSRPSSSLLSSISLPRHAIRHASRSAFPSDWAALAARHRSRIAPDARAKSPAVLRESKEPFQLMPRDSFFAMLDSRFPREPARYGHSEQLENILSELRRHQQEAPATVLTTPNK
ncbi:hypothetical protein T492DRAFT_841672 [Pavlovales sp. CCMP2436]|nr:hypothetical protein T492DRAFT_841672 [Pavlovales sp. CCMP2436]